MKNVKQMQIGDLLIDSNHPLVIPEIGINHSGSLEVAKKIVHAAYISGAKIIKHQTHVVEDEMASLAKSIKPGNSDRSIYDIMNSCALTETEEYELMQYTESLGLCYLSTPFSRAAADRLEKFGVKAYKIGSGELNNYPLLKHVASFGKPMIVSTGMNSFEEIDQAVQILDDSKVSYALLHTTNLYPTTPEQVRLGAMRQMMDRYSDVLVGLSDHTLNNNAAVAAIAQGAAIVERHFTDDKERKGPDIICSMDPNDLRNLLEAARDIPKMLGGEKRALKEEKVTINFAFASVVSIRPIRKGEVFTEDNLWVKRPGVGDFLARDYEGLLGRKASKDIPNDMLISRDMVE